jgi:hypothetical protein
MASYKRMNYSGDTISLRGAVSVFVENDISNEI